MCHSGAWKTDCFIPPGSVFPVCTNMFIYGVPTCLFGNVSLPFSFVQHLLNELLSTWKSEKKQIDLQVTRLYFRTRIKNISLPQSSSSRGKHGILKLSLAYFNDMLIDPTQVRNFTINISVKQQWHSCLKKHQNFQLIRIYEGKPYPSKEYSVNTQIEMCLFFLD